MAKLTDVEVPNILLVSLAQSSASFLKMELCLKRTGTRRPHGSRGLLLPREEYAERKKAPDLGLCPDISQRLSVEVYLYDSKNIYVFSFSEVQL